MLTKDKAVYLATACSLLTFFAAVVVSDIGTSRASATNFSNAWLKFRVAVLEKRVERLEKVEKLLSYVQVELEPINGVAGPHVIIEGANLHVRSGSGVTDERDAPTGLGNLIVGYNEDREVGLDRTGSHNLVIGPDHAYSSHGGLVAGIANKVLGLYATVTGGADNAAEGDFSAVSGGTSNTAEASLSAVGGGTLTSASSLAIWAAGDLSQGAVACTCPPCDGCSDAEKRDSDSKCSITCNLGGVVQ